MNLSGIGWNVVGWIHLAQDRDQWRTVIKILMNLRVLSKAVNFLTSWTSDCLLLKNCVPWSWLVTGGSVGLLWTWWETVGIYKMWSWNRSAQSVYRLGYRLDDRVSFTGSGNDGMFSLWHRIQTGSGAHPASYQMITGVSFPRDKAAGAWSWPLTSILCRG